MEKPAYSEQTKAALRRARRTAGLSQRQLAERLNERIGGKLRQAEISRWESETGPMPAADLFVLWLELCRPA